MATGLAGMRPGQAQQPRVFRLGFLTILSKPASDAPAIAFLFDDELRRQGFVEGQNLVVERRFAEGDFKRLDALAAELVALQVDALYTAGGTPSARAAQTAVRRAGRETPIVFEPVRDPVGDGFAASLPRPGGNMTGTTLFTRELDAKRAEILAEVLGTPAVLAVLDVPRPAADRGPIVDAFRATGRPRLEFVEVNQPEAIPAAFARMVAARASGLVVMHTPFTASNIPAIARLVAQHRLPAIADGLGWHQHGLMLTYSTDFSEGSVRGAQYVARIFRGERPGDLPVEHMSRFHLTVNLKVARDLGVRMPRSVLARADEIIE